MAGKRTARREQVSCNGFLVTDRGLIDSIIYSRNKASSNDLEDDYNGSNGELEYRNESNVKVIQYIPGSVLS